MAAVKEAIGMGTLGSRPATDDLFINRPAFFGHFARFDDPVSIGVEPSQEGL